MFPVYRGNSQHTKPRVFIISQAGLLSCIELSGLKKKKDAKHFLIFSWDAKPVTLPKVYRHSNCTNHGGGKVNTRGIKGNNSVLENNVSV